MTTFDGIIKSRVSVTSTCEFPLYDGELSMIPFNLKTLHGLEGVIYCIARNLLSGVEHKGGLAYFTIHGKKLAEGETLRRGGAHIDGNYEPVNMSFGTGGGNGWKVGETGFHVGHQTHKRQYLKETGGIILASNYSACRGWNGDYEGTPERGGDCSKIELDEGFILKPNTVYYGNNHFIHESLPMESDVHRVFARITMPEDHVYTA